RHYDRVLVAHAARGSRRLSPGEACDRRAARGRDGRVIETAVVALASRLPPSLQRLLAGGRSVRIDGLELAPDVQLALFLLRLSRPRGLDAMTPAAARAEL